MGITNRIFLIIILVITTSCASLHTIEYYDNNSHGKTFFSNDYQFHFNTYGDYGFSLKRNLIPFKFSDLDELKNKKKISFQNLTTFVDPKFSMYVYFYNQENISSIKNVLKKGKYKIENLNDEEFYIQRESTEEGKYCDYFKQFSNGTLRLTIISSVSNTSFLNEITGITSMNKTKEIKNNFDILQGSYFPNYLGVIENIKNQKNSNDKFETLIIQENARKEQYSKEELEIKFKGYNPTPAIDYIEKISNNQEIIAINENHYNHENRIFMELLLEKLYKNNFRNLFVEGITDDLKNINQVNSFIGYYTLNPEYASFLRKALELGFTVNSYESMEQCNNVDKIYCQNFRDSIQAKNILDKINKLPSKKSIIYAGFSHIDKSSKSEWKKMAQYLNELSGKNIYSIDQSKMGNVSLGKSNFFNYVNDEYHITEPVMFINSDEKVLMDDSKLYDAQVFFPRTNEWYYKDYINKNIRIDKKYMNKYILLYREPLFYQKIPEKIIKIDSENIAINIKKGYNYFYFVVDDKGNVLNKDIVKFN